MNTADLVRTSGGAHTTPIDPGIRDTPPAPTPEAAALASIADMTTLLFAIQIDQQHSQTSTHEAAILSNATQARQALLQVRMAAEQAREAASESSFWGNVLSTLKVVGAISTVAAGVASGIASGGVSTVGAVALAGVLLSSCSKPIASLCGGSAKVQEGVGLGLSIAGAALSVGALGGGLLTGVGTAASASNGVKVVAQNVQQWATVVAAGTGVAGGYATGRIGAARSDQTQREADGIEGRTHQRIAHNTMNELVQSLKTLTRSFEGAKASLAQAQKQISEGNYGMLVTLGR